MNKKELDGHVNMKHHNTYTYTRLQAIHVQSYWYKAAVKIPTSIPVITITDIFIFDLCHRTFVDQRFLLVSRSSRFFHKECSGTSSTGHEKKDDKEDSTS